MKALLLIYIGLTIIVFAAITIFVPKNKKHTPNRSQMLQILQSENDGLITFLPQSDTERDYVEYMIEAGLLIETDSMLYITCNGSDLKNNA